LNKCDLTDERDPIIDYYRASGIRVIETSAMSGFGLDELRSAIVGKLVVFVGKSGVGKSSLVNMIYPNANIKTKTINTDQNQGRHTTTASSLYDLGNGTRMIDTPGIRLMEIGGITKSELAGYFPEFDEFAPNCKYRDCAHSVEDKCAVRDAVKSGDIPTSRYENYLRILKELSN
jgi:ribosome biogenesis GTPase